MRAQALALSLGAALFSLVVPVLPLVRRRAWHIAGLFAVAWLGALVIFFELWVGIGFLGHLGLAVLATVAMMLPKHLAQWDAVVARVVLRLRETVRTATPGP